MAVDNRKTCYAIIVYPESMDMEFLRLWLRSLHMPIAISPIHDCDVFTEVDVMEYEERVKKGETDEGEERPVAGKKKKPHYHVVFDFGKQKKSAKQVLEMISEVLPYVRFAIPIVNKATYTKYLCHLNDPEKVHYPVEEVESLSGYDLSPLWSTTKAEQKQTFSAVCEIARKYRIFNYSELFDVVVLVNEPILRDTVAENCFFFSKYLEGLFIRFTGKQPYAINVEEVADQVKNGPREPRLDLDTGELV